MKIQPNYLALPAILLAMLFTACHVPQHIVGNFDMNNLRPHIDTFRTHHPIIHNGDVITLNVTNDNKDLYTVKLTPNVVSYNTAVPSEFTTALALPPNTRSMSSYNPPEKPEIERAYSCAQLIDMEKAKLKREVAAYKANEENINKLIAYNNSLLLLQKNCGLSADSIKKHANWMLNDILNLYNSFTDMGAMDMSDDLRDAIDGNVSNAIKHYHQIDNSLVKIDAWLNCDSCQKSIKAKHVKDFTDNEKNHLSDVKDGYNKILAFQQSRQGDIIIQDYKAVTEPSNYTVTATSTAHYADEITFNVTISPKNWLPCRTVDTSFNIKLKVARFKIDFSTGVFLNWGGPEFTGKNYFIDSTGTVRQLAKSANNYIPSIGALAHFYYRSGSAIDPGLVLGASLSTDVKYTNFHIGLSFMFNANNEIFNRVALSGGFTYRYVDDLNSGYSVGSIVDKSLTIDQLESGKFIRGGFIALTYNLSKN